MKKHLRRKNTDICEDLTQARRIIVDEIGEPPTLDDDWEVLHGAVALIDGVLKELKGGG